MKKVVLILGIPGTGKTTLLKGVEDYKGYKSVNVGTVMKQILEEENKGMDRDKIRYLDKSETEELRTKTFEKVLSSGDNLLVDTHSTVERNGRFITGLPVDSNINKYVTAIVYIDASNKDITFRRSLDKSRKREDDDEYIINLQRELNLSTISFYMTYLNIPFYIINNVDLSNSISRFKNIIDIIEEDR